MFITKEAMDALAAHMRVVSSLNVPSGADLDAATRVILNTVSAIFNINPTPQDDPAYMLGLLAGYALASKHSILSETTRQHWQGACLLANNMAQAELTAIMQQDAPREAKH